VVMGYGPLAGNPICAVLYSQDLANLRSFCSILYFKCALEVLIYITLKKLLPYKNYCILLGNYIKIITLLTTLVSYFSRSTCPILQSLNENIDNIDR